MPSCLEGRYRQVLASQCCHTTRGAGRGGTWGQFPASAQLLPTHSRYLQLQAPPPLKTPPIDGYCQWPCLSFPARSNNSTWEIQNIPLLAHPKETPASPGWRENTSPPHPVARSHQVVELRLTELKPQNKQSLSRSSHSLWMQSHEPQTHTRACWHLPPPPTTTTSTAFGSPFPGISHQISINIQTVLFYSL